MATWIGLLRGINVGGKNKIKMAELRDVLTDAGLGAVQTHIQSGNLVFESKLSSASLESMVRQSIQTQWGYEVPTMMIQASELKRIVEASPHHDHDLSHRHLTLLSKQPTAALAQAILPPDNASDGFLISGRSVYVVCPNGYSKTKWNNAFFESKLKCRATPRNWKTISKLIEMAF